LTTAPFRYAVAAATDLGLKRTGNEDAFGFSAEHGVYIVCDGMGGAAAGEVASSMAVKEMLRRLTDRAAHQAEQLEALIPDAVRGANQAILSYAAKDSNLAGMGTTLVGLVTEGSRVLVFNVGDSRCYRMRKPIAVADHSHPEQAALQQVSLDHSLVQEQVRAGLMTHAEALNSPYRSVITRALGTQGKIEPDVFELQAEPGDMFLLCSDGLTGEVSDPMIESLLEADQSLEDLCASLIAAANQSGGRDNITCLIVRAESVDDSK